MYKKFVTCLVVGILLTGCASPKTRQEILEENRKVMNGLFDSFNANATLIQPSTNSDFTKTHAELAIATDTQQYTLDSQFGEIHAIIGGVYRSSVPSYNEYFKTVDKLFTQSCNGTVRSLERFEEADKQGYFNPLLYASESILNSMKIGTEREDTFATPIIRNYLLPDERGLSGHMRDANFSFDNYRYSILPYIDFASTQVSLPLEGIIPFREVSKICYEQGKIKGVLLVFHAFKVKDNMEIAGTSKLGLMYIPEETSNGFIAYAIDARLENMRIKDIREDKRKAEQKVVSAAAYQRNLQKTRQRKADAKNIFNTKNIGRMICKDGKLKYMAYHRLGASVSNTRHQFSDDGQIIAHIEGFSDDGSRIKIKVARAAFAYKLRSAPQSTPTMEHIVAEPGVVTWVDNIDWYLCEAN